MASRQDENSQDDPFARIAAVLPEETPRSRRRPLRRSRPSFSELAPIVPSTLAVEPGPITKVVPAPTPPSAVSHLPSVIITDEDPPTPVNEEGAIRRHAVLDVPTARKRRVLKRPPRGLDTSMVLFLLTVSILVFGLGVVVLMLSPRSPNPPPTVVSNPSNTRTPSWP